SLGGVLTLRLAQEHGDKISGIACLAAPAFLHKWVRATLPIVMRSPLRFVYRYQPKAQADVKDPIARKNYWSVDQMPLKCIHSLTELQKKVRAELKTVNNPALLIHSRYDATAPYESLDYFAKNISSKVIETVTLENSFHLITIDYEKDTVSQKVGEFFGKL
ncbi:MAG TPA: alpha/beta hydrolase, partial [bacterium]|nr:alpha/beta hydrolase [bacterium]